jgi:hypothetical protein
MYRFELSHLDTLQLLIILHFLEFHRFDFGLILFIFFTYFFIFFVLISANRRKKSTYWFLSSQFTIKLEHELVYFGYNSNYVSCNIFNSGRHINPVANNTLICHHTHHSYLSFALITFFAQLFCFAKTTSSPFSKKPWCVEMWPAPGLQTDLEFGYL